MIVDESLTILLASTQTNKVTIFNMLYHLTLNDEIREKVRQEIAYHFDKCDRQWDKVLSYDYIGELKYLNQCLLETLRISSPTS